MDQIAMAMNMPVDKTKKMFEKYLNRGYFKGFQYDPMTGMIHLPKETKAFITYTCPNCGASVMAREGVVPRCEYCGNVFNVR